MKLNIRAINIELAKAGKNWTWLLNQLGMKPTNMSYIKKVKPISKAEPIAKILNIEPKDILA